MGDRLVHAKLTDTNICPICKNGINSPGHSFTECQAEKITDVRNKYIPHIERVGKKITTFSPSMYKPFWESGLVPEDPALIQWYYSRLKPMKLPDFAKLHFNGHPHPSELHQYGYKRSFTDGTVKNPDDERFAKGSWAIVYGIGHPDNVAGELPGELQISYIAELFALLVCMQQAIERTWITLDNLAVVQQAHNLTHHPDEEFTAHIAIELWEQVVIQKKQRPPGFFCVTWQKGHIKQDFPEYLEQNIVTEQEVELQDLADINAGNVADAIDTPVEMYTQADQRKTLAQLVQHMQVSLWQTRIEHWKTVSLDIVTYIEQDAEDENEEFVNTPEFDSTPEEVGNNKQAELFHKVGAEDVATSRIAPQSGPTWLRNVTRTSNCVCRDMAKFGPELWQRNPQLRGNVAKIGTDLLATTSRTFQQCGQPWF